MAETDISDPAALADILAASDAVLSCLPCQHNVAVATAAHAAGTHYFEFTEDVPTTKAIIELAAKGIMAPHWGLLGVQLPRDHRERWRSSDSLPRLH